MYSVIIVDDEKLVIQSLQGSINWEEQGFYVMGHALNGTECLELVKKSKPDVIFTDIRMPGMNGLELIKKTHAIYPRIQFVVVSGYAEFAYAQKAINNGAIGYCLKPFDDDEIIFVLKKAKDILDKENGFNGIDIFSILEESISKKFSMINLLKKYGLNTDSSSKAVIAVSIGGDNVKAEHGFKYIKAKIGSKKIIYILPYDESQAINDFIKKLSDNSLGVGISFAEYSCNMLEKRIEESIIAAYQYFISGKNGIYYAQKFVLNESDGLIMDLEETRAKKDIFQIQEKLDAFSSLGLEDGYTIKYAMRVYNGVMSVLCCFDNDYYDNYIYRYEQLTDMFLDNQEMIVYLKDLLSKQFTSHSEIIPEEVKNETFRNILKYVNDNFCSHISIQSLSQEFIVNPSYICQMFKKELGMTFSEYITSMRIARAQNLLKLTDLSVGDVAEKSGYNDYFHFTKTFKKITGMTPTQFRLEKS